MTPPTQHYGMHPSGAVLEVAPDVACLQLSIVNVYLVGPPIAGDRGWVLIDTGISTSHSAIVRAAAERFGPGSRPAAILLTHGHFDHVGAVRQLAEEWDAPVFAHPMEMPYLTGQSDYPPPDPTVGGGLMAYLSPLFSRRGIDLGRRVQDLPDDGIVPFLQGWVWLHTPGHTPGHVSFFRSADRVLIVGDAFVTTKQESALAVLTRRQFVWRPPAYFTSNWETARQSVQALAQLEPMVAATGHGIPMAGEEMRRQLRDLAEHFERYEPSDGRYVREPSRADDHGVTSVPPPVGSRLPLLAAGLGVAAVAGLVLLGTMGRGRAQG